MAHNLLTGEPPLFQQIRFSFTPGLPSTTTLGSLHALDQAMCEFSLSFSLPLFIYLVSVSPNLLVIPLTNLPHIPLGTPLWYSSPCLHLLFHPALGLSWLSFPIHPYTFASVSSTLSLSPVSHPPISLPLWYSIVTSSHLSLGTLYANSWVVPFRLAVGGCTGTARSLSLQIA